MEFSHRHSRVENGPRSGIRERGGNQTSFTGTGYDVTPVLALVPPDLPIVPNSAEVSAWFEAPLGYLLDPANHAHKEKEWFGRMRPYIEIEWQGHLIWGITAAIIANLSRLLAWVDRT